MGVQASAHIAITIDNPSIIPGTVVSGKVYLIVNHDRVDADVLLLRVVGGEYTCAKVENSEGYFPVHSHCIFLDLTYPLAVPPSGVFWRGQYEFPFRFCLPFGILPSMGASIPGNNGGHCSVSYGLEAKLHRRGWYNWDVHHKQEIWVLGPPVAHLPNYQAYLPPIEVPVNFCNCWNQGNVRLGISTDKTVLAAGESFELDYAIQNNSTSRIKAMEIALYENVIWRAGEHIRRLRTPVFFHRLEDSEIRVDLSPTNTNSTIDLGSNPNITNPDILLQLKNILDSRQFRYPLSVDPYARTSMESNLIEVEHHLIVSVKTPFGSSNPEILAKLTIHRHGIQATPYAVPTGYVQSPPPPTQLPPNWQANVAPPRDIPMPGYQPPNIVHSQESLHNPDNITTSSSVPSGAQYHGIQNLFILISNSFNPITEFQKWCENNRADELTTQQIQQLYQTIRKVIEQLSLTDQLIHFRTFMTCNDLSAILFVANDQIRIEIVKKVAIKVKDKENSSILKNYLTPYQFLCCEQYFK